MDAAIVELQTARDLPMCPDNDDNKLISFEAVAESQLQDSFSLAEGSALITTVDEAISLCKLDELKVLAKEAKVQGKNKSELVNGLRRSSKQQSGIQAVFRRSDTELSVKTIVSQSEHDEENIDPEDETKRADSPGFSDLNRDGILHKKIMDEIGQCIRLAKAPLLLFERVHLVFYRSSEWTEKSLTTIILARIAKRNFPKFIVSRSASIFEYRELLLEFEASLRMQFRVDSILEFSGFKPGEKEFKIVMDIYYSVQPRWREIVQSEQNKEQQGTYQSGEGAYLRRLSPAWVYTRIMHKASTILAKQKQHKEEHDLMIELLDQRLFHHARRGAWYQRKALLEEHYMADINSPSGTADDMQKRKWKRIALRTSEEGIEDPLVHIIYHHDLQKRIRKLEKACKIPMREQHDFSHVRLAAPVEVYVEGVRVYQADEDDLPAKGSRRNSDEMKKPTGARGTKTIWLDPLEGNGECSVEAMCLSHYRTQGWKGFHCEGRLVRTLFAYLFFDVMFLYVPNVFQTPFQTCPLDLHTDAFYPTRMSEINRRLVEIENGIAPQLIQEVWDQHFENKTCVVGLDWAYEIEDLLEISSFFDGHALATICKVFCQEYGTRGGGLPDLFLWHPEKKEVKFSEVKSENDRLSDTQRLWIDVLTGAGVRVELCHAVARKA
jgi:Fanconi-associated nuclease 1